MKILQVLPELRLAGAQIMVENLTRELIRNGNTVEVVSLYSNRTPLTERMEKDNIPIHFLEKKSGFDITVVFKLRKIIKEFKPDVIHSHTYSLKYAYFASRFVYKRKIVHTVHNIAEKEASDANKRLQKRLFNKEIVQPVAISPIVKETILKYYCLDESQVPMIYNGISLCSCIRKASYKINEKDINIVHIGRLQEQKNHELMLNTMREVVKENSGIKLHCYGTGPLKDSLESMIEKYGLKNNVILEGLTDKQFEVLNSADIFVLPSKWEGMPITLIEAMGTALPIIVTPVGGIPDMIENGVSGIICADDPSDLKNAIFTIISDEELRGRLGKNAFEKAKCFSSEVMEKAYEEIYKGLARLGNKES